MGCCHSTNADPPSPPPSHAASSQPIQPPPRLPKSPKNVSNQQPPWTRSHLERQREIFFETQTSGDADVWATLRTVSTHIRRNEMREAQAIFDAAGLSCPDGNFAKGRRQIDPATRAAVTSGGVYDARGRRYAIPLWCITDPDDLVEDNEQRDGVEKVGPAGTSIDSSDDEDARPVEHFMPAEQSPREDKGKEKQGDLGEPLRVRARLASTAEDVYFTVGSKEPAKYLVEQATAQLSTPANRLRLMFRGKDLRRDQTLEAQGWTKGDTLSVFVKPEDAA